MKIVRDLAVQTGSDTGSSPLELAVDASYTETIVTVTALASGTFTVRAKSQGGDVFETIDGASINLSTHRTIRIADAQVESVELSVSPTASYSYRIEQR